MAMSKAEKKKLLDFVQEDGMWKRFIENEDKSGTQWRKNWGWILNEYATLHDKLQEKSANSAFLQAIQKEDTQDTRKIEYFPNSTNHEYGWIASQKHLSFDMGRDTYTPPPLPEIYHIFKGE